MTTEFYLDGTLLAAGRVRIDAQLGLTSSADGGSLGTGVIEIDDPDGTLTVTGWMPFHVLETQASVPRIWTGYIYDRVISRGRPEHVLATARTFVCTIVDLNANLGFRTFTQDAAKRPRETDVARVAWMLSQTQATDDSRINDNGLVSTANVGQFDEADYRGQYPGDLLESVAASSVKNFYMYWDNGVAEASLFYDKPGSTVRTSTLRISNVDADIDDDITFGPLVGSEVKLTTDPSSTYSGVWYGWLGGNLYVENATTEANFIARDAVYSTDRIGRLTTAQSQSTAWLDVRSGEQDRITVRIQLPLGRVNDILEGQRVQVKFSHLAAYTSFTYVRVVRRTVYIVETSPRLYGVELELSNSTALPGSPGSPGNFPLQPGSTSTPSVVQHKTGSAANILILNATPAAGNLLLAMVSDRDGGNDIVVGTGWTKIARATNTTGFVRDGHAYYRVATGTNPNVPPGLGEPAHDGFFRADGPVGSLTTTLIEVPGTYGGTFATRNSVSATTVLTCGGSVSAAASSLVIGIGAIGSDDTDYPGLTVAPDSGVTELADTASGASAEDSPGHWVGYRSVTTAASVDVGGAISGARTYCGVTVVIVGSAGSGSAPAPGQPVNNAAPSETPNGSTANFTAPNPYATGSMRVQVQGIDVTDFAVTESDPTTGAFALDFAPLATETVTLYYLGR